MKDREKDRERKRQTLFFTGDHCAYCNYAMIALCFSIHNSFMDDSIGKKRRKMKLNEIPMRLASRKCYNFCVKARFLIVLFMPFS